MKSPNIYDIAKLAGVSIATVSRVVNKSPRVREETRQRVLEIMEQQRYTPNVFARGLGLQSMSTIGLVCPDISDPFMAQCLSLLERNLKEHNYSCLLACSGFGLEEKSRCLENLLTKGVDALILVGSHYSGEGEAVACIQRAAENLPVFIINGRVSGENIYNFYCMDYEACYEATCYLLQNGQERILFLSDSESYSARRKQGGYLAAMQDAGTAEQSRGLVSLQSHDPELGAKLARCLAEGWDAVLASEDSLAIAALKEAQKLGLRVPEDLEIIGYNDLDYARYSQPELSSINNHREQLCQGASQILLRLLAGEVCSEHSFPVRCDLVHRGTTAWKGPGL